jgi:hypothetical protein
LPGAGARHRSVGQKRSRKAHLQARKQDDEEAVGQQRPLHILGPFGEDCDLRRHGEKIAQRGGKNAKKRAVVAVARKPSVLLLHRLWVTAEVYEPLYDANRCGAKKLPVREVSAPRAPITPTTGKPREAAKRQAQRPTLGPFGEDCDMGCGHTFREVGRT